MSEAFPTPPYQELAVAKTTGGHGDLLAAIGLADLLADADAIGDASVRLRDHGRSIAVRTETPVHEQAIKVAPGYPYLRGNSRVQVPDGVSYVDYEEQKARVARYWTAQGLARKGQPLDADQQQALQQDIPRDDWRLLQVMNMLSAHLTTNDVHATIAKAGSDEIRREVMAALRAFAADKPSGLRWKASSVQLYNPVAAKGYARLKPDSTDRNDKTKDGWTDPFVEWLRFRGYFCAGCPFFEGAKNEHIRFYVPVPGDVSLAVLKRVALDLRTRAPIRGSGAKRDALAVLWLADFLIRHSEQFEGQEVDKIPGLSLAGLTPASVIAGLAITHYQSLGSARAVSTMAMLALPGWFPIDSADDAAAWLAILDEHRRVVVGLHDDRSDEVGLLVGYRRFLERRGETALWALLDFVGEYGSFLIRAREAGRRVRGFRTDTFGRLVESMADADSFASILADPGFQAVARAVRRATVSAQTQKANKIPDYREIRYDLLPELRRARTLPDSTRFVEVVSDFIGKYNAENARRRELEKRAPANVHTDELTSFVRLVDGRGANVVGALLCAYGTCTEPQAVVGSQGEPDDAEVQPEPLPTDTANEQEG